MEKVELDSKGVTYSNTLLVRTTSYNAYVSLYFACCKKNQRMNEDKFNIKLANKTGFLKIIVTRLAGI